MFRMFMFMAAGMALLSAFALYAISYQTRHLAQANQTAESRIKELARNIAILRAERSYLLRPERLEPLARKLGMRPVRGDQFMSRNALQRKLNRR